MPSQPKPICKYILLLHTPNSTILAAGAKHVLLLNPLRCLPLHTPQLQANVQLT
jgi:hypothetical protein